MRIIFLHGLESTPETSSTAKCIRETFKEVYVPDYEPNTSSYQEIKNYLMDICENFDYNDVVIGISIGGFWALHLTEFTNIRNVILLNPAIERGEERYGVKVIVSPEVGGHLLLNMDDEIVDNYENCQRFEGRFMIDTFQTGGHRMKNLNQLLPLIEATVDHYESFIP